MVWWIKRENKRGQIALEFLIVYSFVLILFLVFFALVIAQRASSLNNQQYFLLQQVAQNVAGYINSALSAGSGYSASFTVPSAIGTLPIRLYISNTGVVIANATIGKQVITAHAFSSARNLQVNGTKVAYNAANTLVVYNLTAYTGAVTFANYKGQVYINQNPPSLASLPAAATLTQTNYASAASFGGSSSFILLSATNDLLSGNQITISAWSMLSNTISQPYFFIYDQGATYFYCNSAGGGNPGITIHLDITGGDTAIYGGTTCTTGSWNHYVATYNGTRPSFM